MMKNIFTILISFCISHSFLANVNCTFRVDMSEQFVGPNGVHLAGGFGIAGYPEWDAGGIVMTDVDLDNIYEATLSLPENTYFEYKFINGNAWGNDEGVPGACNCNGNRCLTTGVSDQTLAVRCFGSCSFCAGNPQFVSVTFKVDMLNLTLSPNGIHLAGNFGFNPAPNTYAMWDPAGIAMTDLDLDLVYEVTLQLAEGYFFEYKFVNGNAWGEDESVPGTCAVGGNRSMNVPSTDLDLPEVCFGSCDDCTPLHNITFRVDMQDVTVSPNGVHLAGNFGNAGLPNWDPAGIPMDDFDLDNVYEFSIDLYEGITYEYKFINGNDWPDAETVPVECAPSGNRFFTVTDPEILPEVCFASCADCVVPGCTNSLANNYDPAANLDDGSCQFNVEFNVDMQYYDGAISAVYLVGSWSGFSTTANLMFDPDLDGAWSTTLPFTSGNYEYKFYVTDGNTFESFADGEPCTVNTGGDNNRNFTMNDSPFVLPVYCWNSCYACQLINTIFSVNMVGQTVAPEGVHLAGSFNGWLPTLMTDNGNNIWSLTVTVQAGNVYEYKFVNGDFLDPDAEIISGGCTVGPLGNRYFTAPLTDYVLPTFCYAQCAQCPLNVSITFRVDLANEIVSPQGVHLAGSFNAWDPSVQPMTFLGYGIYEVTLSLTPYTNYEYKFINGNAWGMDENLPSGCTINFNRYLNSGFSDAQLPVVCFNECAACGGCTDPFFINYNPFAGSDNGTCSGTIMHGCTYPAATNYNASANVDDGSCICAEPIDTCPADFDNNGVTNINDLLVFMGYFGSFCP